MYNEILFSVIRCSQVFLSYQVWDRIQNKWIIYYPVEFILIILNIADIFANEAKVTEYGLLLLTILSLQTCVFMMIYATQVYYATRLTHAEVRVNSSYPSSYPSAPPLETYQPQPIPVLSDDQAPPYY